MSPIYLFRRSQSHSGLAPRPRSQSTGPILRRSASRGAAAASTAPPTGRVSPPLSSRSYDATRRKYEALARRAEELLRARGRGGGLWSRGRGSSARIEIEARNLFMEIYRTWDYIDHERFDTSLRELVIRTLYICYRIGLDDVGLYSPARYAVLTKWFAEITAANEAIALAESNLALQATYFTQLEAWNKANKIHFSHKTAETAKEQRRVKVKIANDRHNIESRQLTVDADIHRYNRVSLDCPPH